MKKKAIFIILISVLDIVLPSCKSYISEDVINSYKSEHEFYQMTWNNISISKQDILNETEDNFKQLLLSIDQNKKTLFNKEIAYQKTYENNKSCLLELVDKSQTNALHIKEAVALGNRFIESLITGGISSEKMASREWEGIKSNFITLQKEADSIENLVIDRKAKIFELNAEVLKKYSHQKQTIKE